MQSSYDKRRRKLAACEGLGSNACGKTEAEIAPETVISEQEPAAITKRVTNSQPEAVVPIRSKISHHREETGALAPPRNPMICMQAGNQVGATGPRGGGRRRLRRDRSVRETSIRCVPQSGSSPCGKRSISPYSKRLIRDRGRDRGDASSQIFFQGRRSKRGRGRGGASR